MAWDMAAREDRKSRMEPVLLRLRVAGPCSPELMARVAALGSRVENVPPKTYLQTEGDPVLRPRYLLSGVAFRYRHLPDGRRQVFDLVLPGEGVGVCLRPTPFASTSTVVLNEAQLVDAADIISPAALQDCPELVSTLQVLADLDERRMLDHIVRLGRMTALERLAHLLLELHDRLELVGQAEADRFTLPLTQETLADLLGLSVVHVNRTLQELRRRSLVRNERGRAWICDRGGLMHLTDYMSRA